MQWVEVHPRGVQHLLVQDHSNSPPPVIDQAKGRHRTGRQLQHLLEQLRPREIAAILGLSEGAVYTRYLRAVRRLQNLLSDYREGETP